MRYARSNTIPPCWRLMVDWALQERLKREYQRANKQNETGIDEDDEADDDAPKTRQAKALEKMIRDREGNNAYESDEDKNPYASSVRIVYAMSK